MKPLAFLLCLVGIAFFEAVEIALISSDRLKLQALAKQGNPGADLSLDLIQRRDQILVSLLVCGTLLSTAAAAVATSLAESALGAGGGATALSVVAVTVLILVFGQVLPKSLARRRAEAFLASVARPIFGLDLLLLPVTAAAGFVNRQLVRLLRGHRPAPVLTREELRALVNDVRGETGPLRQEKRMLQSILDFGRTTAREVMVPMPLVVSVEKEASVDMLKTLVRRQGFTRIPVFERRVDRVVGVVQIFDILLDATRGDTVQDYMRPVTLVPETKRIDRLMGEMQRRGESIVVVVNEFGSCTGIVTIEDIVEEIMGEIADEHEVGVKRIRSIGDGAYIVDGRTDIDDLNEELGLDLPKVRYDTVGGLVLRRLGRIPREGDSFELGDLEFEVMEVYPFGVRTVKLALPRKKEEEVES